MFAYRTCRLGFDSTLIMSRGFLSLFFPIQLASQPLRKHSSFIVSPINPYQSSPGGMVSNGEGFRVKGRSLQQQQLQQHQQQHKFFPEVILSNLTLFCSTSLHLPALDGSDQLLRFIELSALTLTCSTLDYLIKIGIPSRDSNTRPLVLKRNATPLL